MKGNLIRNMRTPQITLYLMAGCALIAASNVTGAPADAGKKPETTKPARKVVNPRISPEDLAKDKNVPVKLRHDLGDYTLVAVVEGKEANEHLTQSLKVVTAQRRYLGKLMKQFNETPANLPQQREVLATQINELKKTLLDNLKFMAKTYAYSLEYEYILVPHEAELILKTEKDGKTTSSVAFQFKNPRDFEDCQKKRRAYLAMRRELFEKERERLKKESPDGKVPADAVKPKPTMEMFKAKVELLRLYQCDPEKDYDVNFTKSALYSRKAK